MDVVFVACGRCFFRADFIKQSLALRGFRLQTARAGSSFGGCGLVSAVESLSVVSDHASREISLRYLAAELPTGMPQFQLSFWASFPDGNVK